MCTDNNQTKEHIVKPDYYYPLTPVLRQTNRGWLNQIRNLSGAHWLWLCKENLYNRLGIQLMTCNMLHLLCFWAGKPEQNLMNQLSRSKDPIITEVTKTGLKKIVPLFNHTFFNILFYVFLSCSNLSRGDCFPVKSRYWNAYFEDLTHSPTQRCSPPVEDDIIDNILNIRFTKTLCEDDVKSHTLYHYHPAALLKGEINIEILQVVCTAYESFFLSSACRFFFFFSYKSKYCIDLLALRYFDSKYKILLNSWITYKEHDSGIMPHYLTNPELDLVDDSFFKQVSHYYNVHFVNPYEPVLRDKFIEYVFLALHFCGSVRSQYLKECIHAFGGFIKYVEDEETIPTVDDLFVQAQTIQRNIRKRTDPSSREYLLELENEYYIVKLFDDKSLSKKTTNCSKINQKKWCSIGISLFSFSKEGDILNMKVGGLTPKQQNTTTYNNMGIFLGKQP